MCAIMVKVFALQHIVPYRCPSAGICYVILYVLFDKGHQVIAPSELLYVSHCLLKLSAIACKDVQNGCIHEYKQFLCDPPPCLYELHS